jgi:hypothetical protein
MGVTMAVWLTLDRQRVAAPGCLDHERRASGKGMSMGESVASPWRKSSYSLNSDCVEWCHSSSAVYVRDSKDPAGRPLTLTPAEWRAFVSAVKSGACDKVG